MQFFAFDELRVVLCETGQLCETSTSHLPRWRRWVTRLEDGGMIEAVMVGRDGVVNGTSALDGKVSLDECVLQVAGTSFEISPYIVLRNELLVAFECSRYHTDWQPKNGVAT